MTSTATASTPSRLPRALLGAALLLAGLGLGWGLARRPAAAPAGVAAPSATVPAPVSAAAVHAERRVLYWYDPMVPGQKFDKPGRSPFMDMQLVPRYAEDDAGGAPGPAAAGPSLAVSTQGRQALGIRLATVETRTVGAIVEAVGSLQLSERDVSILQARTAGFVERVVPHAPGDIVAAGAPLVELLNPDWLAAQQEFLAVRATGDAALTAAARQRLLLLGMPETLVEQVARSGQAQALQTLRAPSAGVITELAVRNGMSVAAGMTLARINGLATIWLEAAVPEVQAAAVRPGQAVEARLPSRPGVVLHGRVAAILPEANRETRSLRVRIELPNPGGQLTPGLFAQVRLQGATAPALVLPAEAVIRTGTRAIVYVAEAGGRYRPVEVGIGAELGDRIVITGGLQAGQQVVASGQFLLDSEASLKGVFARAASAPAAAAAASAPGAMP